MMSLMFGFMEQTRIAQQTASDQARIDLQTANDRADARLAQALQSNQGRYRATVPLSGLTFTGVTPAGPQDVSAFWTEAEQRLKLHQVTDEATQVREIFWALSGAAKASVSANWSDPAECSLAELRQYLFRAFSPSWNAGADLATFLHMEIRPCTEVAGVVVLADARLASRKMKQLGYPTTPLQEWVARFHRMSPTLRTEYLTRTNLIQLLNERALMDALLTAAATSSVTSRLSGESLAPNAEWEGVWQARLEDLDQWLEQQRPTTADLPGTLKIGRGSTTGGARAAPISGHEAAASTRPELVSTPPPTPPPPPPPNDGHRAAHLNAILAERRQAVKPLNRKPSGTSRVPVYVPGNPAASEVIFRRRQKDNHCFRCPEAPGGGCVHPGHFSTCPTHGAHLSPAQRELAPKVQDSGRDN